MAPGLRTQKAPPLRRGFQDRGGRRSNNYGVAPFLSAEFWSALPPDCMSWPAPATVLHALSAPSAVTSDTATSNEYKFRRMDFPISVGLALGPSREPENERDDEDH